MFNNKGKITVKNDSSKASIFCAENNMFFYK